MTLNYRQLFELILCFSVTDTYRVIPVTIDTSVEEVMIASLDQFGLDSGDLNRYRLVEVSLEKGCEYSSTFQFTSFCLTLN